LHKFCQEKKKHSFEHGEKRDKSEPKVRGHETIGSLCWPGTKCVVYLFPLISFWIIWMKPILKVLVLTNLITIGNSHNLAMNFFLTISSNLDGKFFFKKKINFKKFVEIFKIINDYFVQIANRTISIILS